MLKRWQTLLITLRGEAWAMAAATLIAIVLAWLLGRLLWMIFAGPLTTLPEPPARHVTVVQTPDPQRIAALFGENPVASNPNAIVDTTLQLRLDGIFENSDPDLSRAFISDRSQGKIQSYRVGDDVPGGAKLKQIHTDDVVIARNGHDETLRFDKPGAAAPVAAPIAGAAAQNATAVRNAITDAATNLANSPAAALRQMGLRRTSRGYIVSIAAPKEMLQRYGLQPGDRVVSINGQAVGADLAADQQVMTQLQQAGSARVEVQRGEQTITLEQKL